MTWIESLCAQCHSNLPDSAREALWYRGVTDDQMSLYRIGHLDRELPPEIEYPSHFLEWVRTGTKLQNNYVLPLTDWLGEVKGLQLRPVLREKKGYSDFVLDKTQAVLFGLGQAAPEVWRTGRVNIVEGGFDLFPVQRAAPNVIATLTAKVPEQLVRSLSRFVDRVGLFYDNDDAGRRGTEKFTRFYGSLFDTSVVEYPIGVVMSNGVRVKDPADLWEAWGDDRLIPFLQPQLG